MISGHFLNRYLLMHVRSKIMIGAISWIIGVVCGDLLFELISFQ